MPFSHRQKSGPYARRVGNVREVRSGRRADRCTCRLGRRLAAVFALLSCSYRAQTVGLDHPARRAGRSWRARQCGPCPPFRPVSSWVPAVPRTGRSRQSGGLRVKPYRRSGSWPCRCLGASRRSGRQIQVRSSSLKAAGILGRTTGSPTSPSRKHNYVRGF